MYTQKQLDDKWSNIAFESSFEPTLNPFKNGLLVNYKKVGSRYMGQLLSLPSNVTDNKIQMDLKITKHFRHQNSITLDGPLYSLNYGHEKKFCYTEFDEIYAPDPPRHTQTYLEYSNSVEFLKYCGAENYDELFFNNKKDIIFLIRNPIHRFFSGVVQILYIILYELESNKELTKEINFYTGLTESDLENTAKIVVDPNVNDELLRYLKKNEIELLISFLIEKKWDLIFQDIHTNNYLFNYVEWIHHIKDKSKIKIIDLKDCRSNKSLDFFSNLLGNDLLKSHLPEEDDEKDLVRYWDWLSSETGTNKSIYRLFINKLLQFNPDFLDNSSIKHYIKDEYEIYDSLIKSPYYVDLTD